MHLFFSSDLCKQWLNWNRKRRPSLCTKPHLTLRMIVQKSISSPWWHGAWGTFRGWVSRKLSISCCRAHLLVICGTNSKLLPIDSYLEFQTSQWEFCTTPKTDKNRVRERPLNRLKGQPAEKMVTHCHTSLFLPSLVATSSSSWLLPLFPSHGFSREASTLPRYHRVPIRPRKVRRGWRGALHTKVSCHNRVVKKWLFLALDN